MENTFFTLMITLKSVTLFFSFFMENQEIGSYVAY